VYSIYGVGFCFMDDGCEGPVRISHSDDWDVKLVGFGFCPLYFVLLFFSIEMLVVQFKFGVHNTWVWSS
jgi:hypothetical protein